MRFSYFMILFTFSLYLGLGIRLLLTVLFLLRPAFVFAAPPDGKSIAVSFETLLYLFCLHCEIFLLTDVLFSLKTLLSVFRNVPADLFSFFTGVSFLLHLEIYLLTYFLSFAHLYSLH